MVFSSFISKINLFFIFITSILVIAACSSISPKDQNNQKILKFKNQNEDFLTIKSGNELKKYSRNQLLAMPSLKKIQVSFYPNQSNQQMVYDAIPVHELFKEVNTNSHSTLAFTCTDGFSAPISKERLLNTDPKNSIAYIAIESAHSPWPIIRSDDGKSAGPFYLIWENPEKSSIGPEEWPYQLAGFEVKPSIEEQFPDIIPHKKAAKSKDIQIGFKVFLKNCFTCHTFNKQGFSQMGPDLNLPYSPTEYLKPKFLKMLIRNPQSVRHWPQSRMMPFAQEFLSDSEVNAVIAYLHHMAQNRKP